MLKPQNNLLSGKNVGSTTETTVTHGVARVSLDPGICGFACEIRAHKSGRRTVTVNIYGTECRQIERLSSHLTEVTLNDLFAPVTRNPVYRAAEMSGCHPSCAIPSAVLKAVEVAMEMALPKDVRIKFQVRSERNN